MVKTELIKRSPLRVLEKSIQGGLVKGTIAVLASRKGVGKTACLVHIATDKLLQGKSVIHVSYSGRTDYIINWYKDLFKEIAKNRQLDSTVEVHEDIIKNRVIMNFKQEGTRTEQVLKSIETMIEHGKFEADTVIVDGYDFSQSSAEDLRKFREFASKAGLEVWFSASLKGNEPLFDEQGIPHELKRFLEEISVLITLSFKNSHVRLHLVKNYNFPPPGKLPLRLDPKTLLIAKDI